MPRSVNAVPAALLAALIGPAFLTSAARAPKATAPPPKTAAPPSKAAAPPAKTAPHSSVEPTPAQLPPVDPVWQRNGWHAVVPHAYVLRALAPARARPEPGAPAAFWLKGGVRVPILEQRSRWWRVGWTHGRSGWIPAADLQPHASFILIDVRTGRVLRRLAAKGEQGAVSDGRSLWSLSDTGVTRMSMTDPPSIWSDQMRPDRHGSLPLDSVWTPDRSAFFLWAKPNDTGGLLEVSTHAGAIQHAGHPDDRLALVHVDAQGRVLLAGRSTHLYDTRAGRELRRAPGTAYAVAQNGTIYAWSFGPGGRPKLIRYDASLKTAARVQGTADVYSGCVSPDGHVLALCDQQDSRIDLRRADTLVSILTLHPNSHDLGPFVHAVVDSPTGWWTIAGGEPGNSTDIAHFTREGQRLRTWDSDGPWVMSSDGRVIVTARASDLLILDTTDGAARRIPYRWRRPLPAQYLPNPSDADTPTHLDISALTLTPDGRTLILTEWLNGDPKG